MKNITSNLTKTLRRATITVAIITAGITVAPAVQAKPKPKAMTTPDGTKIILASPQSLPELARQNGEAMLLHETGDGRTVLYVEQDRGARLAIFDVSDPSDIKAQGSIHLDASGPFDFVAASGDRAETVRFRESQSEAVLDLRKASAPAIKTRQALTLPTAAERVDSVDETSVPTPTGRSPSLPICSNQPGHSM